jgi:3-phosphoglycerate kinase
MKTIDQVNFEGKKALIRVDFNVPLNDKFEITDDTRIAAAIPTINKILKDGGSVILMSHLGRHKNGPEDKFSLKHIVKSVVKELEEIGYNNYTVVRSTVPPGTCDELNVYFMPEFLTETNSKNDFI